MVGGYVHMYRDLLMSNVRILKLEDRNINRNVHRLTE